MNLPSKSIHVAGCDIQYRELGSGQPLVYLHGGGGYRWDERTFTALADAYHLLLPSAPGFDASTPGSTDSIEDVAAVMAAFISSVAEGGRAHVIGESFGGYLATWMAINHPSVVNKLVLSAPAGLRQDGTEHPSHMSAQDLQAALFGTYPVAPPTPEQAEQRERNRKNSARIGRSRPQFDTALLEQLHRVQAATLVLWGTEDTIIWPSQSKYYQERIPNVRIEILQGGPHALSASVPERFLPAVLGFLNATPVMEPERTGVSTLPRR